MIVQAADWLFDRIDLVPLFAVAAVLCCFLLYRVGILRSPLSDAIYLTATLSLAAGYGFAFSTRSFSLTVISLAAPQTYILLAMASFVGVRKIQSATYRAPSPWWIVLVAVVGHAWTHFLFFALGGAE